jgi:hypothetical protein
MLKATLERDACVYPKGSLKALWLLANSFWAASGTLPAFLLISRRQVIRCGLTSRYGVVLQKSHYVRYARGESADVGYGAP